MSWKLYDFVDDDDGNEFKDWSEKFFKRQKKLLALFNQKLDMLEQNGTDVGPNLLTPTKSKHIMEIVINGEIALRVLLSKNLKNKEFTLLYGATERDSKYVPEDALERAEERRQKIISNPQNRRCLHEPVEPKTKKKL
ncbi:MAG: hypothetical protein IH964_08115 [Candidatus Dadabacteria bacterium]|nr:hypothetical protein [Candidatus Dadabacteria bacterium]